LCPAQSSICALRKAAPVPCAKQHFCTDFIADAEVFSIYSGGKIEYNGRIP
jgi:hypothetical protein